jgi:predicted Zn-dependent protease/tetratricopeptide (TPR) repeat protein
MRRGLLVLVTMLAACKKPPPAPDSIERWSREEISAANLFDLDRPSYKMEWFADLMVATPMGLRRKLEMTSLAPYQRVIVFRHLGDDIAVRDIAAQMFAADPLDAASAEEAAEIELKLGNEAHALELIDTATAHRNELDDSEAQVAFENMLALRCDALWRLKRFDDAAAACRLASESSPSSIGPRTQAKLLARAGNVDEALALLGEARRRFPESGETAVTVAGIESGRGRSEPAKRALTAAVTFWPELSAGWACLEGKPCTLDEVDARMQAWRRRAEAVRLLWASRRYAELGMVAQARARLKAADELDAGIGTAETLARAAKGDAPAALKRTLAALGQTPHPHLFALAAVLTAATDSVEAQRLVDRGRDLDPGAGYLNQAAAVLAAHAGNTAAFDAAMARLQRDNKARSDPIRSGPISSKRVPYHLPLDVQEVMLAPRLEGKLPELEGLSSALEKRFPGLKFHVLETRAVPKEWLAREGRQIRGEAVTEGEDDGAPFTVVLIDRDLFIGKATFMYGAMDPMTSRGVVSVARFRTPAGDPSEPGDGPAGDALARSRKRLQEQITSTVAKLIGLSFPCEERFCVLRFPENMAAFDDKGEEFCAKHQVELERALRKK